MNDLSLFNDKNQSKQMAHYHPLSTLLLNKTTTTTTAMIRLYFPHQQGEIGLQQRATLIVSTPMVTIPTGVKVSGLDLHGEVLQLCPKQKKDHDCVTKTLHEELFPGGVKVDVTFYCKGLSSGGCKTKKPAKVCISVILTFAESATKIISSPFTVKGNRRQKVRRVCDSSLRESLSVTTVIDSPLIMMTDKAKPPGAHSNPNLGYIIENNDHSTPSSANLLSSSSDIKTNINPGGLRDYQLPWNEYRSYTFRPVQFLSCFSEEYLPTPVIAIPPYSNHPFIEVFNSDTTLQQRIYSPQDYCIPPDDIEQEFNYQPQPLQLDQDIPQTYYNLNRKYYDYQRELIEQSLNNEHYTTTKKRRRSIPSNLTSYQSFN